MMRSPLVQLALALVFVLIMAGAYAFWYASLTSMRARSDAVVAQINEKNAERAQAVNAASMLATLDVNGTALSEHFVSTADVVSFLENIETMGKHAGATVSVANVTDDNVRPLGHITLSVSVHGTFAAVMNTIAAFEYGPYALSLSDLALSEDSSDAKRSGTWTATLVLSAASVTSAPSSTP